MSLKSELLQSANLTNVRFDWNSLSFLTRPSGCNGRCAIYISPGSRSCGGSWLYAVFPVPPACDLDKGSEEYRITVPLFGAVSSPCCVNLAMRGNAEDHQHEFSPKVVSTALKNLFVDDSLKSLPFSNELIKYDCDLRNLMSTEDVKWVSNDRLILDSTPERN